MSPLSFFVKERSFYPTVENGSRFVSESAKRLRQEEIFLYLDSTRNS